MIALQHKDTGEIQLVTSRDGYGAEWKRVASPPDADAGTLARLRLATGAWGEDADAVEAALIVLVKAESERRATALYSGGPAKLASYAAKRGEVEAWRALGGVVAFNALAANVRAQRFRFTLADAAMRGDQPADAIARVAAGMDACDARAAAIAGIEQAGIAAVRAAATAAAKRQACAAIDWSRG